MSHGVPMAGFFSSQPWSDANLLQPLPFNFSFYGQTFDEAALSFADDAHPLLKRLCTCMRACIQNQTYTCNAYAMRM